MKMQRWGIVAAIAALVLGMGSSALSGHAQGTTPDEGGAVEWSIQDATAPYPQLVVPEGVAWFGYAGNPLYMQRTGSGAEVVIYLPPAGCPDPALNCESVCPYGGCETGWVSYRWPTALQADAVTVIHLPNTLPWYSGDPGAPVRLMPGKDGTLIWTLPGPNKRD